MRCLRWLAYLSVSLIALALGCDSSEVYEESPDKPLQPAWRHSYQVGSNGPRMPPEVAEVEGSNYVLFAGQGRLEALNVGDGSVKWSTQLHPRRELKCRDLIVAKQSAFCSHLDKAVSWNLVTGNQLWQFKPPAERRFYDLGYFALGPNYFYGSGRGGHVFAIDRKTGSRAFVTQYQHGAAGLTYASGAVYFSQAWTPEGAEGQSQGGIMKIDAADGDSLWNFRTERGGFYRMRPFVDDGVVYAGTQGGENTVFVALDAVTGEVIWRNEGVRVYAAEMAASKIFVNDGSDLVALDKKTGRTLWRARLDAGHGEYEIAYLNRYLYHPHGRSMRVVDAETGEIVHVEAPPDGSYFWHVGTGAGQVFAQSSGFLVAYEPYQPSAK